MKHNSRLYGSALAALKQASVALFATVMLLSVPVAGNAQVTSSDVRGVVTDDAGSRLANAAITVRNETTGLTRSTQTNASGDFNVRNLPVGENYSVTVALQGYGSERSEGISLNLGQTSTVTFALSASDTIEEIVVTGARSPLEQVAVGPSASFGLAELQSAPTVNRNIVDVLRMDPRIFVDESRGGINQVQCGGKNSRYNSLTVDGVRLNDSFGLNDSGYPTERMPFSYDAISQVAVELAPFDVEYGGFSACNINAVTKSGGNEFSGSAFYDYTDDSLRSDKLEGDTITSGAYEEKRYGVTFGGPIIKDKLFFFAAYEKLEGANLFDRGPIGSGTVNEVSVTQAELDEIAQIARDLYLYDPGPIPLSLPNEDEKLLVKLDWNISDQQRLSFTYDYNEGDNFTESDSDLNEFEFFNHLYERGAELNSYVATLYSDWTDNFSTEVRVGYLELDNRQISVAGTDFGEIQVNLEDRVGLDDMIIYLGADDSRQSNKLDYDVKTIALKGNYYRGNHSLTFGVEQESLQIINLFVQHTETEVRFDGIDEFRDGFASAIYYNNAPSNNPSDAAPEWGYDFNSAYVQDEFQPTDRLTIVAGIRYDWYTTSDSPAENADFVADYGFSNSSTLDGEGLLQPRLGFTFDLSGDTTIRGGIGLYSGGNPNVWLSNSYSANNVLQFGQRGRSFGYTDGTRSLFDPDVVYAAVEANAPAGAGPGWGVPQELFDGVAGGTGDNFEINYLDPNFRIPQEWKFALGVTHVFPREYVLTADALFTVGKFSPLILHGDLDQVGTTAEGRPDYDSVREASFVLANSSKGNRSALYSLGLAKSFDNGFDFRAGYAYSDAEDVQPMNSAVAFSNYNNRAFFAPQEDVLSTSDYNIEHRFTFTTNWRKELFARSLLTLSLYGSANSGFPYSRTVSGNSVYGFTPFLDGNIALEPGSTRNDQEGSWWRKLDFRANLDLPGFGDGHNASVFLVIDNLTNLLNNDWGVLRRPNFPRVAEIGTPAEVRVGDASRYEIRFGVQYAF